ncbi:MAG TPA: hypothetical protein VMZ53_08335, partial [Kofleriaceae bacterium]|nr:hypothetical protein [Kofleriaceae bacterium]
RPRYPATSMRWMVVVLLCVNVAYAQPAPDAKAVVTPAQKREAAAHRAKAKAFVAKKQRDKAIVELEASVAILPTDDALYELATLYDQIPDEDKAFSAYQRIAGGNHLSDASARLKAIIEARTQRAADAAAKAEAEAKAKAEAEAKARTEAEARARRTAEESRQRAEREDRDRRDAEANAREAALRKSIESRHDALVLGAKRAEWDVDREKRRERRARGKRYLRIGVACGAVAGVAAGIAALQQSRVDNGGFATASDISFAISSARIATYAAWAFGVPAAVGIGVGLPLLVLGRDRGEMRASVVANDGMQGIALSGEWR